MLYFITMQLPALLFALFYFSTRGVLCKSDSMLLRRMTSPYEEYEHEPKPAVCPRNLDIKRPTGRSFHSTDTTKNLLKNWKGDLPFDCKFTVSTTFTPFDIKSFDGFEGFFAVLQRLSLRKKHDGCLDYIQFRKVASEDLDRKWDGSWRRDNRWEKEICGEFSVLDGRSGRGELLPYALEVEDSDDLEVRLHLGKAKLLHNQTLDIQIAFTPASFFECKYSESYKPCGNGSRVSKCIHKQYFGDGVVNCPYDDCYDEGGCSPSKGEDQKQTPSPRARFTHVPHHHHKTEGFRMHLPSGNLGDPKVIVYFVVSIVLILGGTWLQRRWKLFIWCCKNAMPEGRTNLLVETFDDKSRW